jgi:Secretion system C-terminal sorting domain
MNFMKRIFTLLSVILLFNSSYIYSATCTWTGAGGTPDWLNPLNWSCGTVPTNTDDIVVNTASLIICNTAVQVNNLTVTAAGATFFFNGTTDFFGTTTLSAGSGSNAIEITLAAGGTNQGVMDFSSAPCLFYILNADFNNQGTIWVRSHYVTFGNSGTTLTSKLINTGTFKVEYDAIGLPSYLSLPFTNNGTLSMEVKPSTLGNCTLIVSQDLINNSIINLNGDNNSLVFFSGSNLTINSTATFNPSKGSTIFAGGALLTLNKSISLSGTAKLSNSGATFQGSGGYSIDLTGQATLELSTGVTGVYVNNLDASSKIILKNITSGTRTISRDVVNYGIVTAEGGFTILSALFTNYGTYNITTAGAGITGTGALTNEGTINHNGLSTGITFINVRTTNRPTKTINVNSGEIYLRSYDNSGNLSVASGAKLRLGGTNVLHYLRSSSNILGAGLLAFELGNHQIDYAFTPTNNTVELLNGAYLSGSGSLNINNSKSLSWYNAWVTIPITVSSNSICTMLGAGTIHTLSNTFNLDGRLNWQDGTPRLSTNGNLVIGASGSFNIQNVNPNIAIFAAALGSTNIGIQNCGFMFGYKSASINVPVTSCNTSILNATNTLTFNAPFTASGRIQASGAASNNIGTLTLNPSLSATSDAKFEMEVSTATADKIVSAGNIALNGKIRLILDAPYPGTPYTLFSSTSGIISGYNASMVEYSADGGLTYTTGLPANSTITNNGTTLIFKVDAPGGNNITWNGGTGDWNTASQWDLGRVPLTTDNVFITQGRVLLNNSSNPIEVNDLTLNGATAALQQGNATNFKVNGNFQWREGELNATINTYGNNSSVSTNPTKYMKSAQWYNYGTLTWTSGILDVDNSKIYNYGLFDINNPAPTNFVMSGVLNSGFINFGNFISQGATAQRNINLDDFFNGTNASIKEKTAGITFNYLRNSGEIRYEPTTPTTPNTSLIRILNGSIDPGTTLVGLGTLQLETVGFQVSGFNMGTTKLVIAADPAVSFGGVLGSGSLFISGQLDFQGGKLGVPLIVQPSGVVNLIPSPQGWTKTFKSSVFNDGTMNWKGGDLVLENSFFYNQSPGSFNIDLSTAASFTPLFSGGAMPAFMNCGVMKITKTSQIPTISLKRNLCNRGGTPTIKGSGTATYSSTLDIDGYLIQIGDSPGALTIDPSVLAGSTTVFEMEMIGGYGAPGIADDYDKLESPNTIVLDGTLKLILNNPAVGTYNIFNSTNMSGNQVTGSFSSILYSVNGSLFTSVKPAWLNIIPNANNGNSFQINISTPLPIELISFQAQNTEGPNKLTWQTASEKNTSHFDIEKSKDGLAFEKIGVVKAAGNSQTPQYYSYLDRNPYDFSYYRLKIHDLDGKTDFSKTVSVRRDGKLNVKIYPNPAQQVMTVDMGEMENATLTVIDVLGKTVYQKTALSGQNTMDVSTFSKGVYIIEIKAKGIMYREKIIKN